MNYWVYYQRFFGLLRPREMRLSYLGFTHRLLKRVEAGSLEQVYIQMQGENWSPRGEARPLTRSLHLGHTSLSVGDVVQDSACAFWLCNIAGWLPLPQVHERPEHRPALWLATEATVQSDRPQVTRLKISSDKDCLPADAYTVESFAWTSFTDLLTLAGLIEQRLGLEVCIDLGEQFYETGEAEIDGYEFYVGYTLNGGYVQVIISVLADSPDLARQRVEEELKKPGRQHYLDIWIQGGRLLKVCANHPPQNSE